MQVILRSGPLPDGAIEAAAACYRDLLPQAQVLLAGENEALAIVLPAAPADHDDWRRALARDLARAHAPRRVNVVGAGDSGAEEDLLAFLGDAPGVTGQYLAAHE